MGIERRKYRDFSGNLKLHVWISGYIRQPVLILPRRISYICRKEFRILGSRNLMFHISAHTTPSVYELCFVILSFHYLLCQTRRGALTYNFVTNVYCVMSDCLILHHALSRGHRMSGKSRDVMSFNIRNIRCCCCCCKSIWGMDGCSSRKYCFVIHDCLLLRIREWNLLDKNHCSDI